jgi:hypothetical protein
MDNIGDCYALIINDPELRRGQIMEAERSARPRAKSRIWRRARIWFARGLHGLAAHIEASVPSSTGPVVAPIHPEAGSR